jgi:hypothetical protein
MNKLVIGGIVAGSVVVTAVVLGVVNRLNNSKKNEKAEEAVKALVEQTEKILRESEEADAKWQSDLEKTKTCTS